MYCHKCKKEVNYFVKEENLIFDDNKEVVEYLGKRGYCENCNEELFIDEIEEFNQNSFEKAYKDKYKIIKVDEINQILKKYQIGKRPLSTLLGFGEITITRYIEGFIPTLKNSKILKNILNNEIEYYNLLIEKKDLLTDIAYNKSKKACEELLGIMGDDLLLENTAGYIINNCHDITNLQLQKLLYFIYVFYYMITGESVFSSNISAWKYGPVYANIYYKYKHFGSSTIVSSNKVYEINGLLKEITDNVIENVGCFSGNTLIKVTHKEGPWYNAYRNNILITDESVKKYCYFLNDKYEIRDLNDIKKMREVIYNNYLN